MSSFAIIVPCYNEASRLNLEAFINFGNQFSDVHFLFVNDGSTDATNEKLKTIESSTPNTQIIKLLKNSGKGEAIRQGLVEALKKDFSFIGYLDADLSTSLQEFYKLHKFAQQQDADFVLASRVKKIDTVIERSFTRHIAGRMIATVIDKRFNLGVYDTQCGAKIFKPSTIDTIVLQPFYTKWFFDVEILLRIKRLNQKLNCFEVPLSKWHNVKNSKINLLSFPLVLKELSILSRKY